MSETARKRLPTVDDAAEHPIYYDEGRGTYHTRCVDSDYEPVSTAVLAALSSIRGVGIEDLESLSSRIDPDALNAFVTHWTENGKQRRDGSITFPFARCVVTVRADGEIVIEPERDGDESIGS